MSWRHSRLSKGMEAFISRITADGPSEKRPPHMLLELSLRSGIVLLLPVLLAIGACDRPSQPTEQASGVGENTAAPAGNVVVEEPTGTLDRSHKGEAAPAVTFEAPNGSKVTLADFKGKPLLLNLWATWCIPCIKEMPTLDALAGRLGDKAEVLTVSQDLEGAAKVDPWFQKAGLKHLQPYLDPEVRLSTHFGANLPTTVLYDSQGREVWRMTGGMDWAGERAAGLVAEAR